MKKPIILLADDDKAICTVLEQAIRRHGYEIIVSDNGKSLLELVEQGRGDVVITDIMMPGIGGLELIPKIKAKRPDLPIIVISAVNTLLTAVKVNQLGAYEYLPKPFDLDILLQYVDKALNASGGNSLNFDNSGKNSVDRSPIIGRSPAMQEIYRILARIVSLDLSVMITGESGTGKELIAQALHNLGDRKNKPFIAVNVAAIPKELIESELFGHEKGSFTGAINRKAGAFEQAGSGTLFLDEIGDMPLEAQTRLLRVLQQGEYTSVGGSKTMLTSARIITATHRDLLKLVKKGTFREDLYYRLNVVHIKTPPLRERREDIAELIDYFTAKAVEKGLPRKEISHDALPMLQGYNWHGNVRELENLIYRLSALYSEPIIDVDIIKKELFNREERSSENTLPLPEIIRKHVQNYFVGHGDSMPSSGVYDRLLPLFEKPLLEVTLEVTDGNQIKAAAMLGINRNTLRKKINQLGIELSKRKE